MDQQVLKHMQTTLYATADALWEDMEALAKKPTIQPSDVISVMGTASGTLSGLAAAVGWHVHEEDESC